MSASVYSRRNADLACSDAKRISVTTDALGDARIYVASDCGGQQWIFAEPITA